MPQFRLGVLLLTFVTLGVLPSAMAADPPKPGTSTTPMQPPTGIPQLAPKFSCSMTPGKQGELFQTTNITVKKLSGQLLANTNVVAKFGIHATGQKLADICATQFTNNVATANNMIIAPPINPPPPGLWVCNANVSGKCPAPQAPQVPK